MRTSRIARETAKVTKALSPARRHQTRSSLASYAASADQHAASKSKATTKDADDTSSLSSIGSDVSFSEAEAAALRSGKRKRDAETPVTTPSGTTTTTRKSPRRRIIKVEEGVDIEEVGVSAPKKARRQPAKQTVDPTTGEVAIHPPPNWEDVYAATQEMRKLVLAPVDTMGCERAGEDAATPRVCSISKNNPPQLLASVLLTSAL